MHSNDQVFAASAGPVTLPAGPLVRRDGLSLDDALRTARHIAGQHGVTLEPVSGMPWHYRMIDTDVSSTARAAVAAFLVERHGFGVTRVYGRDSLVDLSACPDDATPEEREQLAQQLSQIAEDEAEQELAAAGESDHAIVSRAADAGRQELLWCRQQTLVFLRLRTAD